MGMMSEFKDFAIKGNVVDMAVGLVIGAAFGKIVSAFVANIVTPPIGLLMGGVDFKDLGYVLKEAGEGTEAVVMKYGLFIQSILDFVIIAFAIFMVVRAINSAKKKEEAAAPAGPTDDQKLLAEIRDALKK